MKGYSLLVVWAAILSCAFSAPQFISFKEGRLGVNFGGYHAGVGGLGGALGGGAGGGLFAEAGTPHGQAARAGLGGAAGGDGGAAGGLYAGATAGGNVQASAGLAGGVAEKAVGGGYASAQAGDHVASSALGGASSGGFSFSASKSVGGATEVIKETEVQPVEVVETVHTAPQKAAEASGGFSFSANKSFGGSVGVVKEIEVPQVKVVETVETVPQEVASGGVSFSASKSFGGAAEVETENFQPLQVVQTAPKKVHHEFNFEAANEVKPIIKTEEVYVQAPPPVIVKEIYVPQPVVEKRIIHTYRPRHKAASAYIGGYIGGGAPPPPAQVVYQTAPAVQKRVDIGVQSAGNANYGAEIEGGGAGHVGYTKTVSVQRNPTFFADIFNIPIQTLRAVGNFLGNTAGSTSISVQKSASVHADSDSTLPKHASSELSSSSSAHVTVETPPVSKFIDDIFAIPINTLGAVNKFLENNIPARKKVIGSDNVESRIRLGPKARRRANRVIVLENESAVQNVPPSSEAQDHISIEQ